jgi:tol-pal system protein YbgF
MVQDAIVPFNHLKYTDKNMKKTTRNILFLLAICPFLVQCASQDEVNRLNYQLRVVNKKLNDMKNETVDDMQKRQAASSDQMDQLQNEIMTLRGQLEETARLNKELTEQNRQLETSFKSFSSKSEDERQTILKQNQEQEKIKEARLAELSAKLSALQTYKLKEADRKAHEASLHAEEAKAKASEANKNLSKTTTTQIAADKKKPIKDQAALSEAAEKNPSPTPSPQSKPAVKNTEAPAPGPSAGPDVYGQAMAEYNKGNFGGAFKHFEGFIGKNETGEKSIEARYMMGECLFKQKEYDQSILQYQKIVSNYPQHPKAAAALLRQGMAFESLSDKETAKIIYKKIISAYGSSPEAATAKQRSGSL